MVTENHSAGRLPSILALLFVTLHVSAFVAVTVLQFRHVRELEQNLSVRRADIADLVNTCGTARHGQHSLHLFKRSLDELARKNATFDVTWKLVNSRQTTSVSSLMSSVLQAQEQQLIQKCSGDVKICLSGDIGDPGTKGDKGFPGAKGDTGAPGIAGIQGPAGLKGTNGISGTAGTKGHKGLKGTNGPHGLKGEAGTRGSKGLLGPIGATGSPGAKGGIGETGENGMKGPKGSPGLKGKSGADGVHGLSGMKGDTGDQGPHGLPAVYTGPVCGCIEAPYISTSQESIPGTIGGSLSLTCLSDGSPPSAVTWYKINDPGCKVNGTSGNILTISNLEPSDIGQYMCVASNSHGNASKSVDVTTTDSLQVLECSFESQTICHWTQSRDNKINMTINYGSAGTSATGPSVDHTLVTATGKYLYLGSSPTLVDQTSRIESMTVPANQDQCFTAWYKLDDRNSGSLQIYKKSCDGSPEQMLLSKAGNHGQGWHEVSVSIPADPAMGVKLIIQAKSGNNIQGYIALDDLHLTNGLCAFPPPVIAGSPNVTLTTPIASQQVLTCNASGNPDPTITWSKPTSCQTLIATGNSHTLNPITFGDGGKYTCTATNGAGNTTRDFILKINGNLNCDLDHRDMCGWASDTSNAADTWQFHSGNTASSNTGPSNDHTKGTSNGLYLYLEASGKAPNATVVLMSPTLPALNDVCLKFWYNMNGLEIGGLNVYTKDCQGVKSNIISYVGDKGDIWQQSCSKILPLSYEYNLYIEGVVGTGFRGDIAIDDIKLSAGSCGCSSSTSGSVNASCDFETDLCGWTQDTIPADDFDWTLNSGPTASVDTGPSGDHTTGTGQYVYIEASSPNSSGDVAHLVSPALNAGQSYCLDYWYHMFGANVGTITVYTQVRNNSSCLHTGHAY
ncbi:MAM and LDL-receptor class A domain-containing protein 1-like isoform X2 [Mizuhopecten yessoensis]|uniref:MAM and LDL-receptor class A domain-containing protein 1-like isoform X2 n=1 Tax=Mizuhopecten yessoensis TaxID=6573 RepID=UPI000B45D8C9|nr:MAM and LDL-receptor class A domain-containing protein 1-like isoform X2 [Mizuhopecten yessoensis]